MHVWVVCATAFVAALNPVPWQLCTGLTAASVGCKKKPEPNWWIKIEMFGCHLVCLYCSWDVCRLHNSIKRVPLLALKKWRERLFLAAAAPLLCLECLIGFLLAIACLVLQLHVCIRDDVLHASCDWQLAVCCLDCLALKRRVLEPPVFGACAECGMHWSCCCPPVLLLLVVSPKGPCVRGWCEPVLSGCACRVQRGQTYVVTFSMVTRRVLGCFVWLQRLFRPYFWEYKWGTNKRNGGVSSAESMLASIGNTTTVRLLFAAY